MNKMYCISDDNGNVIFSFEDMIECYDFSKIGYTYLFLLIGVPPGVVNVLAKDKLYTLKCVDFDGRLSFEFSIEHVIESHGVVYVQMTDLRTGKAYIPGVLSLLKVRRNDTGRIWLDMRGKSKEIYLSASYLLSGEKRDFCQKSIIIEGKYIHDYYSFFCEMGYVLFGAYGYAGDSFYSFEDCISPLGNIDIIWKDSEISLKAIDNTIPEGFYGRSAYDFVTILENYCSLKLL